MAVLQLLGSLAATLGAYGLYRGLKLIYEEMTSPLRDLPGPKSASLIYGNFKQIWDAENSVLHEKWVQEYGSTIQYSGLFGMRRLYTMDTKALNHVLMNSNIYQKPEAARYQLSRVLGTGVLVVEGDKHKQQNPAFGPSQVRELTEIFFNKAIQLRDIWAADNANQGGTSRVDALSWLSRTTLDIIGLAGFNYKFDALSEDPKQNELNAAFATIFKAGTKLTIVPMLRAWFPVLRFLRTDRDAETDEATKTMSRIGSQLVRESKASINEKSEWKTRDLLSVLHQRMTDQDVLARTLRSTGTTWALYALTQDKAVQEKLRQELLAVDTDNPTMDELNALPYLDMVVRETMRIHAPVASTIRAAVTDDILPLNKPFTDRKGVVHDTIRVSKGQTLMIPILAMNRDKSIWGEDAMEFRPERWEKVPEAAAGIPGVWGNMLTFLGGPRACIGYRFSLVETKALLFTLIRAFEFELAVPVTDIVKKSSIVQRPVLVTDPEGGNQMPLLIRPVVRE
ncbi:cytochrome P450 [Lyophyllum atratum]|nr:cytochrome P450 [Lyophyllum atratum]